MSERWVAQVFSLKLRAPEQLLLLVLAHAADDDGIVRNLSDMDLAWMLGEIGDRLHALRQSLIKQGVLVRIETGDGVTPDTYKLCLAEGRQRRSAPLDLGMNAQARLAMIQSMACTCQHCGRAGSHVFDADGQVWRIVKLQLALGLSSDNVTLLCARCAEDPAVPIDRLPSAADYGLRWGQRYWMYPDLLMLRGKIDRVEDMEKETPALMLGGGATGVNPVQVEVNIPHERHL